MISKSKTKNLAILTVLALLLTLTISACSPSVTLATPTPTKVFSGTGGEDEAPILTCPKENTLFNLWFSHLAVLDIDAGDGETFYLEFENIPPSYFQLWINSDGVISTEHAINETEIGYHGIANHPDSDDCPIQTFDGVWEMIAEISGTCQNSVVYLHIKEEWVDPVLRSDCGEAASPGPGLFSAPELDLVFDLKDKYPADGITIPEGGPFHASYNYHLYPTGFELPPRIPED
jgi:hypothetical protein